MDNCKTYEENIRYHTGKSTSLITYLNSHLLGAPREYVLHGLVPGLDWVSFWPPSPSMHLVAMSNPVSCCLSHWVGFHTHKHNITTLHDKHAQIYVNITSALLFFFLCLTLLPLFLAGWLVQTLLVWHNDILVHFSISLYCTVHYI
jgi:hypothetical protein